MIALLLFDMPFEQDIRELFMAFYPGRTYIYKADPQAGIIFTGRRIDNPDGGIYDVELIFGSHTEPEAYYEEHFSVNIYNSRTEVKNELKRQLYRILSKHTGIELPWGTLTGIRPVKIAVNMMESGFSTQEVLDEIKTTYLTGKEKACLCVDTALNEIRILKDIDYNNGWSLYIGIPFCPSTCLYCSFTSYPISRWALKKNEYIAALCRELEYTAKRMKDMKLHSIYIGGGTPTSLEACDLETLLSALKSFFNIDDVLEFSVEAGRPDSITYEKLLVLKKYGVDRISVNPQSMNLKTLNTIGRNHDVDMVKEAFALARKAGFLNINMDVILGLPGEDAEDVQNTFYELKRLAPESITVHCLALKRAARLNTEKYRYKSTAYEAVESMLDISRQYCRDMGLMPYYLYRQKNTAGNFENVGYSKAGCECIYNIMIMEEKQTIIGCGAGSTSKIVIPDENRIERAENVKDPALYIERIKEKYMDL